MRKEHGKSEVRQRDHCTSGHRSVQRFHFRGRQSMGSLEDCCRGKRLRSSYVASHECCAEGGASHRLCVASSIPSGRLRKLAVHCAYPEGGLVAYDLRKWHLGWRDLIE